MNLRYLCVMLLIVTDAVAAEKIAGIGPAGEIQRLHTGFAFTEGPAADKSGSIYFSDIPGNRIHRLDAKGELTIFAEPSGHCNGLMVIGSQLIACEMDGRMKSFQLTDGAETILSEGFEGKRYNAPNDLVVDRTGGIYFTDPRFRAPEPLPQVREAVYYRSADGNVTRLVDDRQAPNGVILSPDEKTLYVIPSMEKEMWAYPVDAPGKIGAGKVFCELKQASGKSNGGGDGLTVDENGNLYITSAVGIQVFSSEGQALGTIEFPEQPANVTFGGPAGKTLYVTARKSLYAVDMEVSGHVFSGPKS